MNNWNGLPDHPERKGWHWVASKLKPNGWLLQKWVPECRKWNGLFGTAPAIAANLWVYGCPALNPPELAQMLREQREKDAQVAERYASQFAQPFPKLGSACGNIAAGIRVNPLAIRALTDEPHE